VATRESWTAAAQEQRVTFIDAIYELYFDLVGEFYETANLDVERYTRASNSHRRWRWAMILGTGFVALLSIAVSYATSATSDQRFLGSMYLSLAAAAAATGLTVLANLENFGKDYERAQGHRESREHFLDAAREFEQLWLAHVNPYYPNAEACLNAIELQRRICVKDAELRGNLKDLTKVSGTTPK
jgi:hypothetical protein